MFGMSFGKLAVLIGLIVTVWMIFGWIRRAQALRDATQPRPAARRTGRMHRADARGPERAAAPVEDLVPCPSCGAYVAGRGARACGRSACPYPG